MASRELLQTFAGISKCLIFADQINTMENKKRKIDFEHWAFNNSWTLNFFIEHFGKCVCLICRETIEVKKVLNKKHNYEVCHNNYNSFLGVAREDEVARLKNNLLKQSSFFTFKIEESDRSSHAGYEVSRPIVERIKPFSNGEFFEECMMKVVEVICPEKKDLFSEISLSFRTVM
ncbi:uncharacterized protein LOC128249175 [Octopus bimaculoides]|uniref:uncharacterized protein LOC128249175 n=1 Tax=Octopus bimaculoides TaxID=37653 RepID=UPI0022E62FCE|nr:uncharacterized protein LOC128249175 [Octopus bimaculoides]